MHSSLLRGGNQPEVVFRFIDREKTNHPVARLCRVLKVSRSGYYDWRKRPPSNRTVANQALSEKILEIHERSRGTYGSPRIQAELQLAHGWRCCRRRIARLMREQGLAGIHRRRSRRRGGPRRLHPLFDDLVERNFMSDAPNELWVADITQHPTGEGWLFLAVVLDAYSRRVVGWAMSERATGELVVRALQMALRNRDPNEGVIHHSDQGAQYTALSFGKHLEKAGILGSMGRVGSALDNAMAESFFATLQTELLDRHDWSTRDGLRMAIFDFLEVFYNRQRRHSSLDYLPPEAYEQREEVGSVQAVVAKLEVVR